MLDLQWIGFVHPTADDAVALVVVVVAVAVVDVLVLVLLVAIVSLVRCEVVHRWSASRRAVNTTLANFRASINQRSLKTKRTFYHLASTISKLTTPAMPSARDCVSGDYFSFGSIGNSVG